MAAKEKAKKQVKPLSKPRKPTFDGVETTPWADVPKTFEHYIKCYYKRKEIKPPKDMPEHFADCADGVREWISEHSILGNPASTTFKTALVLPVVNPATGKLNAGGIRAAMVFVSRVKDIDKETLDDTQKMLKKLYKDYFPKETESKLREGDVPVPTFKMFKKGK